MRVAVVGSGVAGLVAARLLSRRHDVVLYEADDRFGGHACTVRHQGEDLDCGFLVCNERTYPGFLRLLDELGVATRPTEMSFSLTCTADSLTWSGRSLLAQAHHVRTPGMARLARDLVRWLRLAPRALQPEHEGRTLGEVVDAFGLSDGFRRHFLAPFASALWSTGAGAVDAIPAEFAVRFFVNHGLVGFRRAPWLTVEGGSRRYVDAIVRDLGPRARSATPVRAVVPDGDGVAVRLAGDVVERADRVVLATHADVALGLLADPGPAERRALGRFRYSRNDVVVHSDPTVLPARRADWSAWNVHTDDCRAPAPRATVSYSLDRLLGRSPTEADRGEPRIVTLNRTEAVAPERVIARFAFDHPVYDHDTVRGQAEVAALPDDRVLYAGAHLGWGFHEDGVRSGVAAAERLGVTW